MWKAVAVILALVVLVSFIGASTLDYSLKMVFGKDMPYPVDFFLGGILIEVTVPTAIGCFIAIQCDVEPPFFGPKLEDGSVAH